MSDFLYDLLPAVYRELDRIEGGPLQALLRVIDAERERLERETDQLYADWFIETCAGERLAQIGALLGADRLLMRRAAVANAIACRRRKGTFAALERAVADASGLPALAKLRDQPKRQDPLGAEPAGAEPVILDVQVWRQTAYGVENSSPFRVADGRFTFHPMGIDAPLFHVPVPNYDIERRMTAVNTPARILPDALPEMLSPIAVNVEGVQSGPLKIVIGDLKEWKFAGGDKEPAESNQSATEDRGELRAVVDPLRGRLMLERGGVAAGEMTGTSGGRLRVSYAYGFTTDVGGGPYPRQLSLPVEDAWVGYVRCDAPADCGSRRVYSSLIEALGAFYKSSCNGTIVFADSATYDLPETQIDTCGWGCPPALDGPRCLTLLALNGEAPCLRGCLRVLAAEPGLRLTLDGLWVDGLIEVGGALTLEVRHSTIRPSAGGEQAMRGIRALPGEHPELLVVMAASICGPVELPRICAGFEATDSIVESVRARTEHKPAKGDSDEAVPESFRPKLTHTTVLGGVMGTEPILVESILGAEHEAAGVFASTRYGDPEYARLSLEASTDLLTGAADGAELGAYHSLNEPLRRRQAQAALDEFIPVHVKAALRFED